MKQITNKILFHSRKRSIEEFKRKPFDSDYLSIFLLSYIVRFLCSGFSVATGYFFISTLFNGNLSTKTNIIISIVLLVLVESIKYYLTPMAFNRVFKKKWIDSTVLLMVVIPIYCLSIFISVKGATYFFDNKTKIITENIEPIKLNTIHYYDSLIEVEQSKLKSFLDYSIENNTLKWKTTSDQISKIENRIDNLITVKNMEIQKSESKMVTNETLLMSAENNRIYYLVNLAYLNELLLFLAFVFSQYFMYRSYNGFIKSRQPITK